MCVPLSSLFSQAFTQRGFVDFRFTGYPEAAPNDSGRAVGEALVRWEPSYRVSPGWRLSASFDARTDSHRQVEREAGLSWWDRGRQRPAFEIRRLSAGYNKGPLTLELGKQFIRWGKADVLNPTDRFAPRDYLAVVDNEFLGVTAARLTWEVRGDTLDLVYEPRFTPSRTPLLNQRWVALPLELPQVTLEELAARNPGGPQLGLRWNHVGRGFEHSLSFFEGYNHLPLFDGRIVPAPLHAELQRYYPKMRMYGGDAAVPLKWLTLKGEASYFTSGTPRADDYAQYVIQAERQAGEWFLAGGYAGEYVRVRRSAQDFAPDRGLARSILGRAGYTIDVNRSLAFEGAIRQNGDGVWLKFEYTQALGSHWRATASFTVIRGAASDFLGQYHRNSHGLLALRYSF